MTTPNLTFVTPKATPVVNTLIYGPPGSGKTTAAMTAPGPILMLNGDRPNATLYGHRRFGSEKRIDEAHIEGLDTLVAATKAARSGEYATVILDTVGEAYRILLDEASGSAVRPKQAEYGDAGTFTERFCRNLMDAEVHAVLVCHEFAHTDEATGEVEHLPFVSSKAGSPALGAKLMAMVDVVAFSGVVETENEGVRYMAQTINARGRRGKDRFGVLGPAPALNLGEWIEAIHSETPTNNDAPKAQEEAKAA